MNKEEIKSLRIQIDGLAQLTKELKPIKITNESMADAVEFREGNKKFISHAFVRSREVDKTIDSLYLAKAWLGEMMQKLGTETPYKNNGNRKSIEDIEPTADVFPKEKLQQQLNKVLEEASDIADRENLYNKQLISEIISYDINWTEKSHIEKVDWLREEISKCIDTLPWELLQKSNIETQISNCYTHLSEAKFWLGFELQRNRENEK